MSRLRTFLLVFTLLVGLPACSLAKTKSSKVLLVLVEKEPDASAATKFMLKNEINVMVDLLKEAGYQPVLASPTGQTLGSAYQITPDLKLADVKVEQYAGVIFPCMDANFISPYYPEPLQIAQKAAALKIPVAAQDHGIFSLSIAGVMDGKQYALVSDFHLRDLVPYGVYQGEGVVQDGNILTSGVCPMIALGTGKPDGTKELTQKMIEALKANE